MAGAISVIASNSAQHGFTPRNDEKKKYLAGVDRNTPEVKIPKPDPSFALKR